MVAKLLIFITASIPAKLYVGHQTGKSVTFVVAYICSFQINIPDHPDLDTVTNKLEQAIKGSVGVKMMSSKYVHICLLNKQT